MVISGKESGYETTVSYFPNGGNNPIAKLTLSPQETTKDSLYSFLKKRATNRGDYLPKPIPAKDQQILTQEASVYGTNTFVVVSDIAQKEILIESILAVERLMYHNKIFHTFFFVGR